jgi:hypothetical protein
MRKQSPHRWFIIVAIRSEQIVNFVIRPSFWPQRGVLRASSAFWLLLAVRSRLEPGTVIAVNLDDGTSDQARIELARVDRAEPLTGGCWLLACRWQKTACLEIAPEKTDRHEATEPPTWRIRIPSEFMALATDPAGN